MLKTCVPNPTIYFNFLSSFTPELNGLFACYNFVGFCFCFLMQLRQNESKGRDKENKRVSMTVIRAAE